MHVAIRDSVFHVLVFPLGPWSWVLSSLVSSPWSLGPLFIPTRLSLLCNNFIGEVSLITGIEQGLDWNGIKDQPIMFLF